MENKAADVRIMVGETIASDFATDAFEQGDELYFHTNSNRVRVMWGNRPRSNATVKGKTMPMAVIGVKEGRDKLQFYSRLRGFVIEKEVVVEGTWTPPKPAPWADAEAQKAFLEQEALSTERGLAADRDYYEGDWFRFNATKVAEAKMYSLVPHDRTREQLFMIARHFMARTDGQRAYNRRYKDDPPNKEQVFWMGGERDVIPKDTRYVFGEKVMQLAVWDLHENIIPDDVLRSIISMAKAALESAKALVTNPKDKAKYDIPPDHGLWIVASLSPTTDDTLGKHKDDDYLTGFHQVVSLTARGSAKFGANPNGATRKQPPSWIASDKLGFVFDTDVLHWVEETKTAPRLVITVRGGKLGARKLFIEPEFNTKPPPTIYHR